MSFDDFELLTWEACAATFDSSGVDLFMTLFVCSLQYMLASGLCVAMVERLYSCLMMEKSVATEHIHGRCGLREVDNGRQRKFKLLFNGIINSQSTPDQPTMRQNWSWREGWNKFTESKQCVCALFCVSRRTFDSWNCVVKGRARRLKEAEKVIFNL